MECNYCGGKVKEDNIYCPNCGEKVNTKKKNPKKEDKAEVVVVDGKKTEKVDQSSDYPFLFGLLGFFVPIAGLVLFIVWRQEKPKDSTASGIGALIRVILLFIVIVFWFYILMFISRF